MEENKSYERNYKRIKCNVLDSYVLPISIIHREFHFLGSLFLLRKMKIVFLN